MDGTGCFKSNADCFFPDSFYWSGQLFLSVTEAVETSFHAVGHRDDGYLFWKSGSSKNLSHTILYLFSFAAAVLSVDLLLPLHRKMSAMEENGFSFRSVFYFSSDPLYCLLYSIFYRILFGGVCFRTCRGIHCQTELEGSEGAEKLVPDQNGRLWNSVDPWTCVALAVFPYLLSSCKRGI